MFEKVLVANRGEIAVRIMRTLREMGIGTVAVYSDVDEKALHVLSADEAVPLGDPDPAASYLNAEKIIAAARQTGAQAIHPGYGFLSENAAFAKAVNDAGLVFIGPDSETISTLGDKTAARRLMKDSGVPIIPGAEGDESEIANAADEMGYPVLIKAAAGGGGKGMRVIESPDLLAEGLRQAASEAKSAFGDGTVYLEKYLIKPRHVEVQILADSQGNALHLYERECSIQRRHQKIIEETPSPALDESLRLKMGEAAVAAAKASGYINAGTVEFLLDATGKFYFLEVNTRLQVEHPITEMITGIDLVRAQVEIAAGNPLPFTQSDIPRRGAAIECRIYAEAPQNNYMPSPGPILFMQEPTGPGVRFDGGVYSGFEVPVHYDPILGKLVVWAQDRNAAIDRMLRALSECVVLGVETPVEFMMEVIDSAPFRAGDTFTDFLPAHFADWKQSDETDLSAMLAFAGRELVMPRIARKSASGKQQEFPSPWQTLGQWDLVK